MKLLHFLQRKRVFFFVFYRNFPDDDFSLKIDENKVFCILSMGVFA